MIIHVHVMGFLFPEQNLEEWFFLVYETIPLKGLPWISIGIVSAR